MVKNNGHLNGDQIKSILEYNLLPANADEAYSHWKDCKDCREKIWNNKNLNVLCSSRSSNIRRIYSKRLSLNIPIKIFCSDYGIMNIKLIKDRGDPTFLRRKPKPSMPEYFNYIHTALENYLSGEKSLNITKIDPSLINSDFQREVLFWTSLIPYGKTATYKQIGEWIENEGYQAIGDALSSNPLPILIPCHRVISEEGKLKGYVGGKEIKKKLLQIEGIL